MTAIQLYNTKTRRKEGFTPIDAKNVRMYLCGPTVYDRAHLGNARPVIVFDVLSRLLRHVYGEKHVTYVRNFTDVDDKINATALSRQQAGAEGTLEELITQRSNETIQWYLDDMAAVGAQEPDHMPRATEYIAPMIAMIEDLIAKDHAYAAEGHVLFRVRSYKDYGALSGRSVDDMIAGARVEVAPYKEDPMDFVLWKPSDADQPGWESPWGKGRPGWHIECSAMAYDLLGAAFDIHGGGNDLTFPHHENEIAQSKCAGHDFANVWMHNEMLQVEGKKMSKSLGNFFTVRDLLDQGVSGEVIRFVMLSTHYRKPMDWTEAKRQEAEKLLRNIAQFFGGEPLSKPWVGEFGPVPEEFVDALANDLNTSLALTMIRKYLKGRNESALKASLRLLGLDPHAILIKFQGFEYQSNKNEFGGGSRAVSHGIDGPLKIDALVAIGNQLDQLRATAMQTKDFSAVDAMKTMLTNAGVEVRMSKEGVELSPLPSFDASKLDTL
jgi:cysteinyl-tRNA synthetase